MCTATQKVTAVLFITGRKKKQLKQQLGRVKLIDYRVLLSLL